ncbi:metal ABC transporter permease [Helicobacter cappadocius]|uniref:Metal ABC transporter permease n=1 Tax=Helicobacter cappadocius TaxID=3063998 RepID=A0AA90PLX1_9HELI|nr:MULTISPECIES: metal ABC transporter permease [unclassified Helicobacter]MDO7253646.1 metal ABC transporter permease [Helicobacter sp. faydin-H75]MDP2539574.1 metal ABC transporter permease [Helicobacter sp. faydin-H76]
MGEFFSYSFVQNALIASFFISICAGIIGSIVVSNKTVFLTGGVAHSAFGGVGVALYFGFNATLGASFAGVLMGLLMVYATNKYKNRIDTFIAASWALGMAIGIILIDLTPGYGSDITSYLFGSIIAVAPNDIVSIAIFDLVLVVFVVVYYRELLSIFYDSEFCRLKKINVQVFNIIIFILVSLGVVMSMGVAGLILVLSILSIPAYIATMFASSLKAQMFLSWGLSLLFMWIGFFVSYVYDLSIGACIVIASVIGMGIAILFKKISYNLKL